jgi:hypothetical protein
MSGEPAPWRSWLVVSPAKSGAANTKRYTANRVEGTTSLGECWWCFNDGTRLCDSLMRSRNWAGKLDVHRGDTCDAVICDECTDASPVHFNMGDEPHVWDSIDKCPYCQDHAGLRGRGNRLRDSFRETDYFDREGWRERVKAHAVKKKAAACT